MNIRFDGKVIVITGGGRGIGAATARLFAEAGGKVIVADRDLESANKVAEQVGGYSREIDISQEDMVRQVVDDVETKLGPIDVLVNCAATLQNTDPPQTLTMKTWDRITNVVLRGTYLMCVEVGTRMAARKHGNIINFASVAGILAAPLHAYGPAKAGLIQLTSSLAAEWGPVGVRVNAIAPGYTDTPGVQPGFSSGMLNRDKFSGATALGRLLQPEEVAAGVLFLASDFACGITGVTLPIDAGFLSAAGWSAYGGLRVSN
jgi:NAD(P)-dependent dehydrogenase (short-subunit alcohol dehydrogenase family)